MLKIKKRTQLVLLILGLVIAISLTMFAILDRYGAFDTRSEASSEKLCDYYAIADFDDSQKVGLSDFQLWLRGYRNFKNDSKNYVQEFDLDNDERVSLVDFGEWLSLWREYKSCYSDQDECYPGCEIVEEEEPECSANMKEYSSEDIEWAVNYFCESGTPEPGYSTLIDQFPAEGGKITWKCINGDQEVSCSAVRQKGLEGEDPRCSGNAKEYSIGDTKWAVNYFCKNGTPEPGYSTLINQFPTEGEERTWKCVNGDQEISCSATRDEDDCIFPPAKSSTLSEYARKKENFNVSIYLNKCFSTDTEQNTKCKEIVLEEYAGMTLEVQDQWKWSESTRGEISSEKLDQMLDFARENGFKVHFFHLIWSDRYSPSWLFSNPGTGDCGDWSREELLKIMEDRISMYIEYTQDVAVAWNVVNEVFKEDGSFAEFCWYQVLGEEFIDKAFLFAREVTDDGLLVFSDNFSYDDNGRMNREGIDKVFEYIKNAKARDIPIDAFGLQNHLTSVSGGHFKGGYLDDLEYIFGKAQDSGVKILITEMDIYQAGYSDQDVADLYNEVVSRCLENDDCISFATWGVSDSNSWLRTTYGLTDARPLLFDESYNRKSSYYAVMEAIRENTTRVCPF